MANAIVEKLAANLRSPTVKAPSTKAGRWVFRGEIGLKYPESIAGESRPPLVKLDQVIFSIENDKINFFTGRADTLAYIDDLISVIGEFLVPDCKYFFFASNVDFLKKYKIQHGGATFYVLPLDEATVYNELLELFYIEKGDLKGLSSEGKVDAIVDAAYSGKYDANFPLISYEQAIKEMGPIKVVENRPV